jgi:hypothetical protein
LQSVARIKIFISTTKAGTVYRKFKDMCQEAGNYISLTWRDHPWKDQEWYEEQLKKAEFDPEVMKEIDVSYAVNPKLQYYPQIKDSKIAPLHYEPGKPLYTGLDFGKNDLTVIVWAQFSGNQLNILECYHNSQRPAPWYAPFLNPELELSHEYSPFQMEMLVRVRGWKKPIGNFGEVAHTIKSMTDNKSIADVLAKLGVRLIVNNYAIGHEARRMATSQMLPKMVFNESSEGVMWLYDAIMNSRYKNSEASKTSAMTPVHDDEISDARSAMENLCSNIGRVFKHQRTDISDNMKEGGFINNLIRGLRV